MLCVEPVSEKAMSTEIREVEVVFLGDGCLVCVTVGPEMVSML
jgi:hypothetical protein